MRLSEIERKDVIDISTGEKIGNIVDIIIDKDSIISFVVDKGNRFLFSSKDEVIIKYNNIEKIGEDVIIVRLNNK